MKVLHAAESVKGGVSTYLGSIAGYQGSSGRISSVTLLIPRLQDVPEGAARAQGGKLRVRRFGGASRAGRCFHLFFAFLAVLREERPDVVHLHSTFAGLVCRLALFIAGGTRRVIYQPHGVAFDPQRSGPLACLVYSSVERVLARKANAIVAISAYEKTLLDRNALGPKSHLVRNTVRAVRSGVAPVSGECYYLFVGRLDRQKGFDALYDFWKTRPEKLVVVGEVVISGQPAYPARENIEFVGWVNDQDIDAYYAGAQALVVPSRWEGFGLVVLEAYRNGTPVICSDRGALPTLVNEGLTGFVFGFDDFTPGLGRAMSRFQGSDRRSLGDNCKSTFASDFSVEALNEALMDVYLK